jgi:hypothetical protein
MEEQKVIERPLMGEEEFKEYLENNRVDIAKDFCENNVLHLRTYEAVGKFKSVRRAIRRGLVSIDGYIFPKRPFHNKANTCKRKGHHSRKLNEIKKKIYEQLKHRQSEQ